MGQDTVLHPGKFRAVNLSKITPKMPIVPPEGETLVVQFQSMDGINCGSPVMLPSSADPDKLNLLLNSLLSNEETINYTFYVENKEIVSDLHNEVIIGMKKSTEPTVFIQYTPQALFRVKPVTRCTATVTGHRDAILVVSFSPNGQSLATGSGDCTVRIWDILTGTQKHILSGHKNWVQVVSWSPDCALLASGDMNSAICVWKPKTGELVFSNSKHHHASITSICWEPWNNNDSCRRFATASRDSSVILWDAMSGIPLKFFPRHNAAVMHIKWSGHGYIYSGSRDRYIRVFNPDDGTLVKMMEGHGHWVNFLAFNTDHVLKSGPYSHNIRSYSNRNEAFNEAKKKYNGFLKTVGGKELLVSCSDDQTLFLWDPLNSDKHIARMLGHQGAITNVCFSNNGQFIASASFDKSVKLWNGRTGEYISSFIGHVGPVFQVTWSPDSRSILSGSQDSTLKLWGIRKKSLHMDLPGHEDSVYSVDWDATGEYVASGGKDKKLKM